jgi:hypothetical protein
MGQRATTDEPHPFGQVFPMLPDSVPSLSSIFDSANNPGGRSIPWMLGSLLQLAPIILSSVLPTLGGPLRFDSVNEGRTDKGKGKARAVDSYDADQPGPEPAPVEDSAFADALREAITASRTGSRVRAPDEVGPSGSSSSTLMSNIAPSPSVSTLLPQAHPSGSDTEQAEIDRAVLMSTIEHVENDLHTLQANFAFPPQLDCHLLSNTDYHASSSTDEDTHGDIVAYLPTTPENSTVLRFVRDLRGLLRQLGRVDSKNDIEAEMMKGKLMGAINRELEDVEGRVEEAIGMWMSLQAAGADIMGR